MQCGDLNINIQDASGDRILGEAMLGRDATSWGQWTGGHTLESGDMAKEQEEDTHVGHVLGEVRSQKKKFKRTPNLRRGDIASSCRIFGSLEGNKVQGDFHITARGHGYMEFGQHLDHSGMSDFSFESFQVSKCPWNIDADTTGWRQHSTSLTLSMNFLSDPSTLPFSTPSIKPMQPLPKTSSNTNITATSSLQSIPDLPTPGRPLLQQSSRINTPSRRNHISSTNGACLEYSSNSTLNLYFSR